MPKSLTELLKLYDRMTDIPDDELDVAGYMRIIDDKSHLNSIVPKERPAKVEEVEEDIPPVFSLEERKKSRPFDRIAIPVPIKGMFRHLDEKTLMVL